MSATEMANKFFGDFVPGCFIHEGFVEKRSLYIASHKALTEKMKANRTSWEIRHRSKNFIMDDLGYDAPIWVKNKDIKFLFMNGRHITLSF
jgi:hypothetical protein